MWAKSAADRLPLETFQPGIFAPLDAALAKSCHHEDGCGH
jgi:hypothetical protein